MKLQLSRSEIEGNVRFHVEKVLINTTFDETARFPRQVDHIGGVDLVTMAAGKEIWLPTIGEGNYGNHYRCYCFISLHS